jgi:hypothetical protein
MTSIAIKLNGRDKFAVAGSAITHYMLGQAEPAKQRWQSLLEQDIRYKDADWVGQELNWAPPLIEATRKLIRDL